MRNALRPTQNLFLRKKCAMIKLTALIRRQHDERPFRVFGGREAPAPERRLMMRFLAPFLFLLTSISSIYAATLSLHAIDSATALVLVDGQIAPGDTHSLQAYIESARTSTLKLAMVSFNSPGGNLEEGYKLATEIKRARLCNRSRGGENLCIGVLFRLRCRNDELDGAQCAHRRPWRRRRQWRPVRDCCVRDHRHRPVGGKGTRHSVRHHWKNGYDATERHHLAVEYGIDLNGRADARSFPFREFELERS